jgi:hypothetical protein
VDGVDARIIYTRKSTPSPVLFQPSIQVLMKKEQRHMFCTPKLRGQGDDVPAEFLRDQRS